MENNIRKAIEQALDEAPERKFVESVEFAFTIKDVDLKNPANRIQEEIRLPAGRGRTPSIAMFADGEICLLYTSPSPRDLSTSRMPSSA